MNLYDIALFIHMLGIVSLFGSFILFQQAGVRLRRARTWEDAKLCLSLLMVMPGMLFGGSLFLLLSGLYMAKARWTFEAPWIATGMLAIVAALVIGGWLMLPAIRRMMHLAGEHVGPVSESERAQIASSPLWPAGFLVNGVAMGMLWVMSTKPGWAISAGLPLVLGAIGLAVGLSIGRRRTADQRVVGKRPLTS